MRRARRAGTYEASSAMIAMSTAIGAELRQVAELTEGRCLRLARAHAARPELGGAHLEVEPDFIVDLTCHPVTTPRKPE